MGVPIPVPKAEDVVRKHQAGMSLLAIANQMNMSVWTVRDIWRRYRDRGRVQPNYQACGHHGVKVERRVYRAALWLKRQHPGWGAPLIRCILQQKWPQARVPHVRTLQRWFRHQGVNQKRQGQRRVVAVKRGSTPHAVWEMDSKVRIRLRLGEQVQWLLISDECSGAVLYDHVFACQHGEALRPQQVQASLRAAFRQWGMPQVLRVDNGDPWGTQTLVPSALALWCIGLGIQVHVNPPRRCTDNGIVERAHGVAYQWSEPERCEDRGVCQRHLDWACRMQREGYAAIRGQTRLEAYPGLRDNPRPYRLEDEEQMWQLERVGLFLEGLRFDRRVDQVGRISLLSQAYSIGRRHKGKTVAVRFCAAEWVWVVQDERGVELKRLAGDALSRDSITQFHLAKRSRGQPSTDTGCPSTSLPIRLTKRSGGHPRVVEQEGYPYAA
jgi:transposase